MTLPDIGGIIGACLTPFKEDGSVDFAALEREIDFIVADCDGISIGAVEAAEYTMLTLDERKELLRVGIEMVDKRIPVLAGSSSASPREVLQLAEHGAKHGANFAQVLMPLRPWGGQPTMSELIDYFTYIGTQSPVPIVSYHNPAVGADPNIEVTIRFSEIPNVQLFKESSRDITKISRLIEEIELSGNARYFTTMQPLLMTLIMGGSGGTMPPPGTRIGAQVVRAFREGDLEEAKRWQRYYSLFPAKWATYGLPPVMKAAMRHFGIDLGDPAPPYKPVTPRDDAQIGQFLRQTGLIEGADSAQDLTTVVANLDKEDSFLR